MINVKMQNQNNRLKPRITVVGVGGAGGNAVNNMINSHLEGCEFLVCNTDAQALEGNNSTHKIQLGVNVTQGLGAGANPELGRAAAEESIDEILSILEGSNMVFVTAGMGGGTGTGAAPVIAQAARESGILTVGVITKPFHFEGTHRMKLAEAGIEELQKHVDTLIIIPNQNLFRIANEKTTFSDAFELADEVLQSGVRGVTDLMIMPGLINLDFADIRAVMAEMGKAMMGTGEAAGERRAVEAAEAAISNPLLDDLSMKGARGVIINITGGPDMTLFEVDEAANRIRDEVDQDANIIFGSTFDESIEGKMRVSVVATGIEVNSSIQVTPLHLATSSDEPSSRPASVLSAKSSSAGIQGHSAYNRTGMTGEHQDFGVGGIPSSILPSHTGGHAAQPMASAAHTMTQPSEPKMTVGHTDAPVSTTVAATARKLDMDDVSARPGQAPTQTLQRPAQMFTSQPHAERHGNSFIPPKPIDPKTVSGGSDLFEETSVSATPRAPQAAEKQVKKSPSLFERFTMQRLEKRPVQVPLRAPSTTKLSVEDGGKKSDEDDLDIPAFLRRQAN
ncbi:MAG: cell division protein FtsZ [Alphaproteobacteria bacterium]|nr:cell division protein FtsZ [Alphaproteobacteria bacterium]